MNTQYNQEREDLAAAFRWTARLNMHEAVANHFSLAVNESGSKFLLNPIGMHFSEICASDLILIDANDEETMSSLMHLTQPLGLFTAPYIETIPKHAVFFMFILNMQPSVLT